VPPRIGIVDVERYWNADLHEISAASGQRRSWDSPGKTVVNAFQMVSFLSERAFEVPGQFLQHYRVLEHIAVDRSPPERG
jgi:hypothetical protein